MLVLTVVYPPGSTITNGRSMFCRRYSFTAGIGVKTSSDEISKPSEASVSATDSGLLVDVLLQILNGTAADFNLTALVQQFNEVIKNQYIFLSGTYKSCGIITVLDII